MTLQELIKTGGVYETKVLDHGYVRFVASMGTDETVIEAARMSTGKGFRGWEEHFACSKCDRWGANPGITENMPTSGATSYCADGGPHDVKVVPGDGKLLEYLYKNFHMSPFEQCELSIEMQAPILCFREIQRHRTGQFNEFSARYAQMPNVHYLPELERFQKQGTANKQGSAEALGPISATEFRQTLKFEQELVYQHYDEMVDQGLAKEVARLNTPVSRYSKMRMKMSMRNWFQFFNLRLRPNAQYETRMFAEAVAGIVKQLWPRSYALFEEYDLNGVRLSATEATLLKSLVAPFERDERFAALHKKVFG